MVFQNLQSSTKPVLALLSCDQFDSRAGEILISRHDVQPFHLRLLNDLVKGLVENERVIECAPRGILREADGSGAIRLRVAVDEECRLLGGGEASGEIDGGSCLSDSPFLVGNRDDSRHGTPASGNLAKCELSCKVFHVEQSNEALEILPEDGELD